MVGRLKIWAILTQWIGWTSFCFVLQWWLQKQILGESLGYLN